MRGRTQSEDLREQPADTLAEAAHHIDAQAPPIRYRPTGRDSCEQLVRALASRQPRLSFLNARLHVHAAIRRHHGVATPTLRATIRYLANHTRPGRN